MSGRFHEADYDGIVLKIPSWFINMNELEPTIQDLLDKLKGCNKSIYYYDHQNNIYELENIDNKKALVAEQRNISKKRAESHEKRNKAILSGDIVKIEWRKESCVIDGSDILTIGEEQFSYYDYFTNKLNVKSEIIKKIFAHCDSFEKFIQFVRDNFHATYHLNNKNEFLLRWRETNFSASSYGANLKCTLNVAYIQEVEKLTAKGYNYRSKELWFDGTDYYIEHGNDKKYFKDFKLVGCELINKSLSL